MTDRELDERMRLAAPLIDFPADFQREIWRRIETTPRGGDSVWARLLAWISRPLPAVAMTVVACVFGCILGAFAGPSSSGVDQARYLKSVSPFEAAKLHVAR